MSLFNDYFYKKVYLIEFIGSITESFAFSVPPENEDISQAQRVTETKTFGGVVYDDYGNDVTTITLSGTTVNQEKRKALVNRNGVEGIYEDGDDEINRLNALITKYGEHSNLKNKVINLYNLSNGKIWNNVVIKNFSYKRSKMSPRSYIYTISFSYYGGTNIDTSIKLATDYSNFAKTRKVDVINEVVTQNIVQQASNVKTEKFSGIKAFCDNTLKTIENFQKTVNEYINKTSYFYKTINTTMEEVKNKLDEVNNLLSDCSNVVDFFFQASGTMYYKEMYNSGKEILESAYRVVFDPPAKIYSRITELTKQYVDDIRYIENDISIKLLNPNNLNPSILGQYEKNTQELVDVFTASMHQVEIAICDLATMEKLDEPETEYTVKTGTANEDDEVIPTYGFTEITVRNSDTYDTLAQQFYGDSELGSAIATYNHDKEVFNIGDKIYIPKLSPDEENEENEIFSTPEDKDNYGHDIKIGADGDFSFFNNDVEVTNREETINQGIINRLTTALDSRIKLNYYGIKSSIGKPQESTMYLKASIENTIKQDPRIRDIEELKIQGSGEKIIINLIYTDINFNKVEFGGVI